MPIIRFNPRLLRVATPLRATPLLSGRPALLLPTLTNINPCTPRTFLNLGGFNLGGLLDSSPVTITVTRTLPYTPSALYRLVSDVDSYFKFVPFCEDSKVTKWTTVPVPSGTPLAALSDVPADVKNGETAKETKVPFEAYLRVGFLGVNETFTSRLLCTPGHSVSALSGAAAVPHGGSPASSSGPLKSLVTKWTITPLRIPGSSPDADVNKEADQCSVQLDLTYDFRDPAKNIAGRAVSDAVAEKMIQAFEARARQVIKGEKMDVIPELGALNIPTPIKAFAKSQLQNHVGKK